MSAEKQEIAVLYKIGENEIKLTPSIVQNYIVGNNAEISMSEFKMFTELCKVRKLNPFLKEAYCIKYGNEPATIVVGKDVIVKRAVLNPMYNGKASGVIVQDSEGKITERQGCFVAPNETLVGGWCKVFRKDHEYPEYMSVSIAECAKKKRDGSYNTNWTNQPATMIEKVAKVRAFREAFVEDLAGMYDESEFVVDKPAITVDDVPQQTTEPEVVEAEQVNINDI